MQNVRERKYRDEDHCIVSSITISCNRWKPSMQKLMETSSRTIELGMQCCPGPIVKGTHTHKKVHTHRMQYCHVESTHTVTHMEGNGALVQCSMLPGPNAAWLSLMSKKQDNSSVFLVHLSAFWAKTTITSKGLGEGASYFIVGYSSIKYTHMQSVQCMSFSISACHSTARSCSDSALDFLASDSRPRGIFQEQ